MRARAVQALLRGRELLCRSVGINNCAITYSQLRNTRLCSTKQDDKFDDITVNQKGDNLSGKSKYKVFEDKDADVILDMYEEQEVSLRDLEEQEEVVDPFEGLNLERGARGVFEIEDLVSVLQREKAKDLFVATVPPEYNYVDYIVFVTGKSIKHLDAIAEFVLKVYKKKRHPNDLIPKREGKQDWIAIDLGNIALHIFKKDVRRKYELETLWSVGPEYDDQIQMPQEQSIMDQYNAFLQNFEPINEDTKSQKQ